MYYTLFVAPIGELTIVSDGCYLVGLWIKDQKYFAHNIKGELIRKDDLDIFIKTINWLNEYFNGHHPQLDIPIKLIGSNFQKEVWQLLLKIPYGQVTTYKDLAQKLCFINGGKMSCQAIGGAVGHNPISIIIPCHRVIGSDGRLTGYAGGLSIKKQLLTLEGCVLRDEA